MAAGGARPVHIGFQGWQRVHLLYDPDDGTEVEQMPEPEGFSSAEEGEARKLRLLWPQCLPLATSAEAVQEIARAQASTGGLAFQDCNIRPGRFGRRRQSRAWGLGPTIPPLDAVSTATRGCSRHAHAA